MVKRWSRKVVDEDDDDLLDDDDIEDDDDDDERYISPRRTTRRYDPAILSSLGADSDYVDEDELDELLAKVRAGKYVPKKKDHYTLHIAYNSLKSRNRPEV